MNYSAKNIETQRLKTRKLEIADAQALFEIFSDPEVSKYWGSPTMTKINEAKNFIDETKKGFQSEKLLEWGVFEKESEMLIGTCAYADWNKEHRRAEIGFALRRDKWGKGFMNELLPEFLSFGFNEIGLHRIEADVDPRNKAAIKLLEKFNFKKEGYLRERYHQDEEIQDTVFFGLLKREYNF